MYKLLACSALLAMTGCDDTMFGLPVGGLTSGDDTGCENTYPSTFDGVVALYDAECSFCHEGGAAAPDFDADDLQEDAESAAGRFFVAGDSLNSDFYRRIAEIDGTYPMPPGSP
jgi:hypothetical protein